MPLNSKSLGFPWIDILSGQSLTNDQVKPFYWLKCLVGREGGVLKRGGGSEGMHTALYFRENKPEPSIRLHLSIPRMNSHPKTMRHPTNPTGPERNPFGSPSTAAQAPGCAPFQVPGAQQSFPASVTTLPTFKQRLQ